MGHVRGVVRPLHDRLQADHGPSAGFLQPMDLFALHPPVHSGSTDADLLDGEVYRHESRFFLAMLTKKADTKRRN